MVRLIRISMCGFVVAGIFFFIAGCDRPTSLSWDILDMVVADDSNIPAVLAEQYRRDAESLALRYLHESNEGHYEGVDISRYIIDAHYYALVHVFNAAHTSARDSVVTIYEIHTNRVPDTRELVVGLNPGATWVEAWRQGQQVTGNDDIDSLMVKYELSMIEFVPPQLLDFEVALLRSSRAINIEALSKLFVEVGGIIFAEPNAVDISIINNIIALTVSDCLQLEYLLWWCDRMKRYWTFNVYLDGRVVFVGSRGSPLP